MIKIAIIGGTGLLGSNLVKLFSSEHDVRAFSRIRSSNISDDLNTTVDFNYLETSLLRHFSEWKPNIIINAVAIVNLKECENNYSMAHYINCGIATQLSKISAKLNAYFVHISTDHYYNDGLKVHNESQHVVLLNNYAKTKYQAEIEVMQNYSNPLIVRTNIIGFRRRGAKSFFEWLLNGLAGDEALKLYTNYYTSPISVNQLGIIVLECFKKSLTGVYNIASSEVISKHNFGIRTAKKFGFAASNIVGFSTLYGDNTELRRALTLGLDVTKIEKALNKNMPTIDDTLENLYFEYMEQNDGS
ncbi:sugar nucleotide-binding protein [Alphaproteobacteria bacterium]|nr:sugar nucleotide-binding protein [Alphaproteobacteria bacterium]